MNEKKQSESLKNEENKTMEMEQEYKYEEYVGLDPVKFGMFYAEIVDNSVHFWCEHKNWYMRIDEGHESAGKWKVIFEDDSLKGYVEMFAMVNYIAGTCIMDADFMTDFATAYANLSERNAKLFGHLEEEDEDEIVDSLKRDKILSDIAYKEALKEEDE